MASVAKKDVWRERERDVLKRHEFQERLKNKLAHQIVYVDEAGIDNRDDYPYGYCEIGQRFYALKLDKRTPARQLDSSVKGGQPLCTDDLKAQGKLWVADTYNHKIKLVDPRDGSCKTVLGGTAGLQDGHGRNSRFFEPSGLSAMGTYLYIADTNNHAIRRVELDTLRVETLHPGLCAPDVCSPPETSELFAR